MQGHTEKEPNWNPYVSGAGGTKEPSRRGRLCCRRASSAIVADRPDRGACALHSSSKEAAPSNLMLSICAYLCLCAPARRDLALRAKAKRASRLYILAPRLESAGRSRGRGTWKHVGFVACLWLLGVGRFLTRFA